MFPSVPQNVPKKTLGSRPKCPPKQHLGNFVPVPIPQNTFEEHCSCSCPPIFFWETHVPVPQKTFQEYCSCSCSCSPMLFGELENCSPNFGEHASLILRSPFSSLFYLNFWLKILSRCYKCMIIILFPFSNGVHQKTFNLLHISHLIDSPHKIA